jgi:hypothetical protein
MTMAHAASDHDRAAQRLASLQHEYDALRNVQQPRIDALSQEADDHARQFRSLYAQARAAWDDNDRALAKALKDQGYTHEALCAHLNAEANRLRQELAAVLRRVEDARHRVAHSAQALSAHAVHIPVSGFEQAGFTESGFRNFLSRFPLDHLANVASVSYVSSTPRDRDIHGEVLNRADIVVYHHMLGGTKEGMDFTRRIVAHEIGEIVFQEMLNDAVRLAFSTIGEREPTRLAEGEPLRDIVAESYMLYVLHFAELKRRSPQRAEFLRQHVFGGRTAL